MKPRSQKISFRSIKAKLHGELEAKSLGVPGTCVAELQYHACLARTLSSHLTWFSND
ncbi:unnamed protein product, partial [Brassica oleracea var. botrytis]